MRIAFLFTALLTLLCLTGCKGGIDNKEAVRQGVMDRLKAVGMAEMNVEVTSVQFKGDKADAMVSIAAKGMGPDKGMQIGYQLEKKDGKWVVLGLLDSGAGGHGAMPPAGSNPHAGGLPDAGTAPGKMPAPEDLPPAGQKK